MSRKINQNLRFWEAVEAELRRTPMIFRGSRLCDDDCALWARSLTLLGMQLQDILSGSRSPKHLPSICKKYVCTLADLDVYSVSATFKWISGFLRRFMNSEETGIRNYHDFKHHGGIADYLMTCCTYPVQREIEVLLASYDIDAFRQLSQLFAFTSHVTFSSIVFDEVVDDFRRIDSDLAITADPSVLVAMNHIMRDWMKDFKVTDENFHPHHGPGGIAEMGRTSLYTKYRMLLADPLIHECLRWHNIDTFKYFKAVGKTSRTSRLVAVPKSTLTSRTICMEPASLQFLQQGVLGAIADWLAHHRDLKRHICLQDQSVNRDAARVGSMFGELATIDLSAASDCVSWELTRALFAGTDYLQWCLTTRSRAVQLPSDEIVQLNKFAPMGSALCFPTECLVFACACEYTRRQHRIRSKYHVYGDDLVIEEDLAEDLILLLESLGFKVNREKSFLGASLITFRESCGGEFVNGIDVTPYRLSRWMNGESITLSSILSHPEVLTRNISMANDLFSHGLVTARNYLVHEMCELPAKFLPLFGDGWDGSILSPYPDHFRHIKRFNQWLFRPEVKTWSLGVVTDPRDLELIDCSDYEDIRLQHWFVTSSLGCFDATRHECFDFDPMADIPVKLGDSLVSLCRATTKLRSRYAPI